MTQPDAIERFTVLYDETGSLLATESVGHASRTAGCPERVVDHGKVLRLPRRCHEPAVLRQELPRPGDRLRGAGERGLDERIAGAAPRSTWLGPNG